MGLLPLPVDSSLATFTLKANGTQVPAGYRIVSIVIQRELDRIPHAHVVLLDGDAARQSFPISESPDLAPGVEIEIDGGYSRQETRLFKGVITRQRIEAGRGRDTFLHLEAKDAVYRASLARRSRTYLDIRDSEVIANVLSAYGNGVIITDNEVAEQIVQHQTTDWDFAVQRANALGMVCDCDGDNANFFRPDFSQAAVASFAFGQHIRRMELEMDAEAPYASVEFNAWSPADQATTSGSVDGAVSPADAGNPNLADVARAEAMPTHSGFLDQAAVDGAATARMERSRLAALRGTVEVQGTADPVPGNVVELQGIGSRFNGNGLVSGIRHEIGRGDWMTTLQFGLDPRSFPERRPFAAAPAAAGEVPPIPGLHIGVVTALEGDPAGEDRIQVRIATVTLEEGLVWGRIAACDAGADRGTVFRPEIDDEVVLGFLDADPRHPIVLGALHSSANPAPIPGSDENHQKGYTSRTGIKLTFDDEKTAVTLETPGGAKLLLDDDEGKVELLDQNGNKVTMERSKLLLEGAADVEIKAAGNVTIEGMNVDVQASAAATVSGSASATLEASGQTTVRGSVVMIN